MKCFAHGLQTILKWKEKVFQIHFLLHKRHQQRQEAWILTRNSKVKVFTLLKMSNCTIYEGTKNWGTLNEHGYVCFHKLQLLNLLTNFDKTLHAIIFDEVKQFEGEWATAGGNKIEWKLQKKMSFKIITISHKFRQKVEIKPL